ncbi:hypothetical protein [Micromonospora echinaurantiaca]
MTSDETVLGGGRSGTDHAGIATSACAKPLSLSLPPGATPGTAQVK